MGGDEWAKGVGWVGVCVGVGIGGSKRLGGGEDVEREAGVGVEHASLNPS